MATGVSDSPPPPVFRLHDGGPEVVREVLLERGWEEYDEQEQDEGDWNLYWRSSAFRNSDYENIFPWQRLNHHPKTMSITRKDCLARNLRRMRGAFGSALYNFSPMAFILPNDYTRFVEEYTKTRMAKEDRSGYWICKPVDLSRGRGIFIFEDIKDLVYNSPVIVQRYISNPLLISGYKFDLRIYVCVKSFHPLQIYMHQEGLVRFATEKYNLESLDNLYSHLTNTSINKFGPSYTSDKERVGQGCKWTMSQFRCFLHSQGINQPLLWQRINSIVTLTLLTIVPSIPFRPNCLELYGFDILIDANFKPWLLEVNYSPALTLDCPADITVKKQLINDLIELMNYKNTDSLRQRGYYRQRYKRPCCLGNQCLMPKSPTLLLLPKSLHEVQADERGYDLQKNCKTDPCVSGTKSYTLPPKPWRSTAGPGGNKRTCTIAGPSQRSEVTVMELDSYDKDLASLNGHKPTLRVSSLNAYCLPSIHVNKYKPLNFHWDHKTHDRSKPPFRVGDFILTFPFNEATWKASFDTLDLKTAVREIHKLNGCMASPSGCKEKQRKEASRITRGQFESLFWGPRTPPPCQ